MFSRLPDIITGTLVILLTSACGVADTGSSAVTAAKIKAQQAEQAQAAKVEIEKQLDATREQAEQRRKDIEAATR